MNNFNKNMLFAGLTLFSLGAHAQAFKEGYVNTKDAESSRFHTMVQNWERNHKLSDDDPFFISRVKPKVRFRNKATQVNKSLDETNDKRLIAWLPYDDPHKTLELCRPLGRLVDATWPCSSFFARRGTQEWRRRFVSSRYPRG